MMTTSITWCTIGRRLTTVTVGSRTQAHHRQKDLSFRHQSLFILNRNSCCCLVAPNGSMLVLYVKRQNDWFIVADMSTPGNRGGTRVLVVFTSPNPGGPYHGPIMIHLLQNRRFLPVPIEGFPAFVHDGYLYAPTTTTA